MRRHPSVERFLSEDTSLDPWIHKFVLNLLLLSILASGVRLVLSLHSYPGEILPHGGTLVSIPLLFGLAYLLWRRPHTLRLVVATFFVLITIKIGFELTYELYASQTTIELQLLWLGGLMSINYLTPFIILRNPVSIILASITLVSWMALTGIYVAMHWQTEPHQEMLIVFSQFYFAHVFLIILMALLFRIRGLYVRSQRSAFDMERLAHTDFLLGTANRRTIQNQLKKRVEDASNAAFSVVLIDIDHFKQVNDERGHDVGDEVLIEIAELISRYSRSFDDFGRWGGEEFLVILPNCSIAVAYEFAQRIRARIETHPFRVGQVTASFGVAEFQEGDNLGSLLKRTDEALYKAKRLGRNRVEMGEE